MPDPMNFQRLSSYVEALSLDERRVLAACFTVDALARQTLAGRAHFFPADLGRVALVFDSLMLLGRGGDAAAAYRRQGAEHREARPEPAADTSGLEQALADEMPRMALPVELAS